MFRRIQAVFQDARHNCLQSVAVTRMLRKDLEVVAHLETDMPLNDILERLQSTAHVRLITPHRTNYVVFAPGNSIFQLLLAYFVVPVQQRLLIQIR